MNISDLYVVAKTIIDFDNTHQIQGNLNSLNHSVSQIRTNVATNNNPQIIAQQNAQKQSAFNQIESILTNILPFYNLIDRTQFTHDQNVLLESINFKNILGEEGVKKIKRFIDFAKQQAPGIMDELHMYITDYTNLKNWAVQITNSLSILHLDIQKKMLLDTDGTIEITFDDKVSVDNFEQAKEQMGDWFLIIHGYALLFDVRNTDFEIVSISKDSPTKVVIKIVKEIAVPFLVALTAIVTLQTHILEKELMIAKLSQSPLTTNPIHADYIKTVQDEMTSDLDKKIDSIVAKQLANRGIDVAAQNNGDKKSALKKSIEKQYQFIINGGDVRIQIGDGNHQEQITVLEKTKDTITQLKNGLNQIKALVQHDDAAKAKSTTE